jgi:hypothetical protein
MKIRVEVTQDDIEAAGRRRSDLLTRHCPLGAALIGHLAEQTGRPVHEIEAELAEVEEDRE